MFKQFSIFVLIFVWSLCAYGTENVALNKSYSYSPSPNYQLCADDLDIKQLTDGKSSGSIWTKKSTVGWSKPEPFVEIVIDLGTQCFIEQLNVHTIGGGAATVEFPDCIAVLISDTDKQYKFAGLKSDRKLANIRSKSNRGISRIMSIKNISALGRFVKIIIRPNGRHIFMDEIEVLGRNVTDSITEDSRKLEIVDTNEKLLSTIDRYLQLEDNFAEIKMSGVDIDDSAIELLATSDLPDKENLLAKQKARIYYDKYKKPFVCLPANPMEIVFEKEIYLHNGVEEIALKMWQNEYESGAFNIINCSEQVMEINLSVSPLIDSDGRNYDSDKVFTLRRAQNVIASQIGSIADALILNDRRPFEIEPGELKQIWLTAHSPQLPAGDYKAKIAVSVKSDTNEDLPIETIPVNLKIYQNRLTGEYALHTCVWDYYQVATEQDMAQDLLNHHTNVCVIPAQDLPFMRFSSDAPGVTRKPDYSRLDNAIKQHEYAKTFLLGMNFSVAKKDYGRFGDVKWMTNDWKNVFAAWLKELVSHLKEMGIDYDKFVLYPFDEYIGDEYYELAQLIKSIDPKIRLYANSFGKGPDDFMRFRELIDIWCLQDSHIVKHPDWYKTIQSFNKELWTYECLEPMKAQSPYSYYRLLPWRAFKRNQSGAGFWIYYYGLGYKPGELPWDDTLRPHGFSGVVYGTKNRADLNESIVPSRRWEAWREGIEDYQYLYELQKSINKIKQIDKQVAGKAQKILDEQVDRVLSNSENCNLVYEAREILTDTLQKLSE